MSTANQSNCSTGDRLLAFLIDFLLLGFVSAIVYLLFWAISAVVGGVVGVAAVGAGSAAGSDAALAGASIVSIAIRAILGIVKWTAIFGVLGGYFVFLQRGDGQSLGKSLMDIKVVSADGGAATRNQLIKRTAMLVAPFPLVYLMVVAGTIIPFIGLLIDPLAGFILLAWLIVEAVVLVVRDGSRLGDSVANTAVVDA
ncbi:RDD family protein [Halococcoides cellulosivorans]|uniref:RDD domain-containing protein n=1 Tax=Halococcoides cellulosivorans TaxID=1679096 RepID=A0A2R4X1P8_9EURY|nr:RDD family protein [Halococcoides cellulosivorans]AWB27720.1 hypothetical protein HARCEL1_08365 [Halococcoides cellulosivorans]